MIQYAEICTNQYNIHEIVKIESFYSREINYFKYYRLDTRQEIDESEIIMYLEKSDIQFNVDTQRYERVD